jgi:hypothetical protein
MELFDFRKIKYKHDGDHVSKYPDLYRVDSLFLASSDNKHSLSALGIPSAA